MSHRNEDLVHAINGTDLLPAVVPEIAEIIKKELGWWYHTGVDSAKGRISIWLSNEKFDRGRNKSAIVGYVDVKIIKAIIKCQCADKVTRIDLQDSNCWDRFSEWLKELEKVNPWKY